MDGNRRNLIRIYHDFAAANGHKASKIQEEISLPLACTCWLLPGFSQYGVTLLVSIKLVLNFIAPKHTWKMVDFTDSLWLQMIFKLL